MYNKITLIGSIVEGPKAYYEPSGAEMFWMEINVSLPSDAPHTYWGIVYDMQTPQGYTKGDETFLVICRDPTLFQRWVDTLKKGNVVCIEGRLAVTNLQIPHNSDYISVQLHEILAHDIILLAEHANSQRQEK